VFDILPNPATDIISFKTAETIEKYEIFDALGRIVQSSGITNQAINISSLPKGIYTVKAYSKNGFAVRKLIKP
jgi:Secretion system C-terminal sorting domain